MVQAGLLDEAPKIERAFALHVWPSMAAGTIASRSGTLMAAAGFFHANFVGHGGHAAMPAEQDPNEADEWQEDQDMLAGGGASLDSHAVHGPVRHLLKDNAQRAVRLVRKRLQHAHRSTG